MYAKGGAKRSKPGRPESVRFRNSSFSALGMREEDLRAGGTRIHFGSPINSTG